MAESWVRIWAGTTTDPKWQTIARKSGQPRCLVIALFAHLLMIANEGDVRGDLDDLDIEDVASALDVDEDAVRAVIDAMDGRVIHREEGRDVMRLSGWERRQPEREDIGNPATGALSAAERKRQQREREKSRPVTQCHDASRHVTQCHAPEAEAEADTEVNPPFDKQQRKAEREVGREDGNAAPLPVGSDPITTRACELAGLLRQRGAALTATNPDVRRWAEEGVSDAQALQALEVAQQRRTDKADPSAIPAGYLTPIIRDLRNQPPGGGARASGGGARASPRDTERQARRRWAEELTTVSGQGQGGQDDGRTIDV